jgi:hypothetical protein
LRLGFRSFDNCRAAFAETNFERINQTLAD